MSKKTTSGSKFGMTAQTFNRMLEAIDAQAFGTFTGAPQNTPFIPAGNTVLVKNNTGYDVPRFGIMGIDAPLFDPSIDELPFKNNLAFSGIIPSASSHQNGQFVITSEPIANGQFGYAVTGGITAVRSYIPDQSHICATIRGNDYSYLTTAEEGPCSVLWKESGVSPGWIIVRFGAGGGGGGSATIFKITNVNSSYNYYEAVEQEPSIADGLVLANKPGATAILIYNLAELAGTSSMSLAIGDFLVGYQVNEIWIGFSPKYSWWHA